MRKVLGLFFLVAVVSFVVGASDTLDVYFLDVGQGDAILIDYGEFEVLIDGGADGSCVDEIRTLIDGVLEIVVATHPHSDHIGGLDDVLRAFDVASVVTNGQRANTNAYSIFRASVDAEGCSEVVVRPCERLVETGNLGIDVIGPFRIDNDANNDSIVLYLHFGTVDFLFTGDIGFEAEATLLSLGILEPIEILKVAHHGSRYSTGTEFLTLVQPEIAIYSAGMGNRYGHPSDEALLRLEASGAEIYGTDQCGTIVISSNGSSYNIGSDCEQPELPVSAAPSPQESAGLLINEVEMNPPGGDSGTEWVEIFNPTLEQLSLEGWSISYTADMGGGWASIPPVSIQPGGYYKFVYPKQHLENSRGGIIQLRNASGVVVDETIEGLVDEVSDGGDNRTWQRFPDGSDLDSIVDWLFENGTPGRAN